MYENSESGTSDTRLDGPIKELLKPDFHLSERAPHKSSLVQRKRPKTKDRRDFRKNQKETYRFWDDTSSPSHPQSLSPDSKPVKSKK